MILLGLLSLLKTYDSNSTTVLLLLLETNLWRSILLGFSCSCGKGFRYRIFWNKRAELSILSNRWVLRFKNPGSWKILEGKDDIREIFYASMFIKSRNAELWFSGSMLSLVSCKSSIRKKLIKPLDSNFCMWGTEGPLGRGRWVGNRETGRGEGKRKKRVWGERTWK